MRTYLYLLAIALLVVSNGYSSEIQPNANFGSPDGKYAAKCVGGGTVPAVDQIQVIENGSGRVLAKFEVNPPLYSIRWTRDSKSLVTVSHIAGGTVAGVIHFDGTNWKEHSADPREGDKYSVIRHVENESTIQLMYKIQVLASNDNAGKFYTYEFVFDPATTSHKGEKRQDIDGETYAYLHLD